MAFEGEYPTEEPPVQTAFCLRDGMRPPLVSQRFLYLAFENDELDVRIAALDVV